MNLKIKLWHYRLPSRIGGGRQMPLPTWAGGTANLMQNLITGKRRFLYTVKQATKSILPIFLAYSVNSR
jgi:hypothetical protein